MPKWSWKLMHAFFCCSQIRDVLFVLLHFSGSDSRDRGTWKAEGWTWGCFEKGSSSAIYTRFLACITARDLQFSVARFFFSGANSLSLLCSNIARFWFQMQPCTWDLEGCQVINWSFFMQVNSSLSASRQRLQNVKEEREQFDEASNQILIHFKLKVSRPEYNMLSSISALKAHIS